MIVKNWSEIAPEHEALGTELILSGKLALVIHADEGDLAQIPNLGLSVLGWKLLQAGNMPVWILVDPEQCTPVHDHVSKLAVPPGQSGIVFTFDEWDSIMESHPMVEHVCICHASNVLATPHPGIFGWHVTNDHAATLETVNGVWNIKGTGFFKIKANPGTVPTVKLDVPESRCFIVDSNNQAEAGELLSTYRFKF